VESSDNDAEKVSLNRGRDVVEASDKLVDQRGGDAVRRSREIPSPWKPENARARKIHLCPKVRRRYEIRDETPQGSMQMLMALEKAER
jgi:hypothetical protein